MTAFEYKEIVRATGAKGKQVVVGHIEKCRSGYFFRPKGGQCRSKLYDKADKVRSDIENRYIRYYFD